eukprot:COSAG03_NODE_11893_length_571_cov_1.088983_2_plen_96_part_00
MTRTMAPSKVEGGTGRLQSLGRWGALLAGSEKRAGGPRATEPAVGPKPRRRNRRWRLSGLLSEVLAVQLHSILRCRRWRRSRSDALSRILTPWLR